MLAYLVVLGAWLVLCFRGRMGARARHVLDRRMDRALARISLPLRRAEGAQGAPPARPDRMTAAMRRAMDINIETHG